MAQESVRALEGRRVLIVNAHVGMGADVAETFAREGATLVLTAPQTLALHEVASRCGGMGGFDTLAPCETLELDLTSAEQVDEVPRQVIEKHGGLDVLVLCAEKCEEDGPLIHPLARQLMHEVTSACKGVDVIVLAVGGTEGVDLPGPQDGSGDSPAYIQMSTDGSRFLAADREFPSAGQAALSCFKKQAAQE
ncbi:hypothetical protein ACKKBF_B02175 [Auxenochlorella protothecoides x Auxenochlorella symbiontica]